MAKPYAAETVEEIERERTAKSNFLEAVKRMAPGTVFCADDLEPYLVAPSPQHVGGLFASPEFKALVKWCGYTRSRRTTGILCAWERLEDEEQAGGIDDRRRTA